MFLECLSVCLFVVNAWRWHHSTLCSLVQAAEATAHSVDTGTHDSVPKCLSEKSEKFTSSLEIPPWFRLVRAFGQNKKNEHGWDRQSRGRDSSTLHYNFVLHIFWVKKCAAYVQKQAVEAADRRTLLSVITVIAGFASADGFACQAGL